MLTKNRVNYKGIVSMLLKTSKICNGFLMSHTVSTTLYWSCQSICDGLS